MINNEVVLCPVCVPMTCCPVLKLEDNNIVITDDYNQTIKIPLEDSQKLIENVDKALSMHRSSLDNQG